MMSLLHGSIDLVAIGIPEMAGEFVTDLFLRVGRGRWQPVAMGDRKRAESAVRSLRRSGVTAWIRPAQRGAYEVIVRTAQADTARQLMNAPSSGRTW
jgi:hypothetical protein